VPAGRFVGLGSVYLEHFLVDADDVSGWRQSAYANVVVLKFINA